MTLGLQNSFAGLGCRALALRHEISVDTASRRVRSHRQLVLQDPGYALAASAVASHALKETYG